MEMLTTRINALVRDDAGQDLLEYALLVALIAIVAAGAVGLAGGQVQAVFNNIVAAFPG
jgi:Flp pilus assembly pilin Flp